MQQDEKKKRLTCTDEDKGRKRSTHFIGGGVTRNKTELIRVRKVGDRRVSKHLNHTS